jgi:hypothetical protein
MNHLATSDDYGSRGEVGTPRKNLSWILKNRQHIPLDETDYQNIDRCVQHKFWSAKMCEWLDTLRSKYDADYLAEKVKKQQKAIVKTIDKQIDVKGAEVRHIQHMIAKREAEDSFLETGLHPTTAQVVTAYLKMKGKL